MLQKSVFWRKPIESHRLRWLTRRRVLCSAKSALILLFVDCYEAIWKGLTMLALRRNTVTLYVNRSTQQWIVLDCEGNLCILPSDDEDPWNQRQPFYPTEETELELLPGHYKLMLGIPT